MNMQVLDARRNTTGVYKVDVSRGERIGRVSSDGSRALPTSDTSLCLSWPDRSATAPIVTGHRSWKARSSGGKPQQCGAAAGHDGGGLWPSPRLRLSACGSSAAHASP